MEGEYLFLTSNGYDYLETYTKGIYGERGTFQHNLQRYFSGVEYGSGCRMPNTIEDIPEVTFDIIQRQIEREAHFMELSAHVASVYSDLAENGRLTKNDEYACAGVLGLCPGQCDWHETLFPHLVDLFVASESEGEKIIEATEQHPELVSLMVRMMMDGIRNHQIINVNGHNVYSKGYARNYFRGESAYYNESRPSLFRNLPSDPNERMIHLVIGNLRMVDFALWLNQLSFVRNWPYGHVAHGAIAQHYGIPTNGMDITSDIKTALFFACCRYEKGKWRPLRNDEFEEFDSRKSVAEKGGDSRYGILFVAPVDVANMSKAANIPSLHLTFGTPIGYQPFMRCAIQSGFLIEAGESYNMYRDPSFQKTKFRHTEEICNWIYKEMEEGKLIYPNESFGVCDDIVETIKASKNFTEKAFSFVLRHLGLEAREEELKEMLICRGYKILPNIAWCTDDRQQELERNWIHNVESNPQLQGKAQFRFGFCI